MSRRAPKWIVVDRGDGTYDVERTGRILASGLSLEQAERRAVRAAGPKGKIHLREKDGYLTVHQPSAAGKK